jgi:hypothetical protein
MYQEKSGNPAQQVKPGMFHRPDFEAELKS